MALPTIGHVETELRQRVTHTPRGADRISELGGIKIRTIAHHQRHPLLRVRCGEGARECPPSHRNELMKSHVPLPQRPAMPPSVY